MADKKSDEGQLIEKVTRLVECLEQLTSKLDSLLDRVVPPKENTLAPNLPLLTEKQREIFDRIAKVPGNDGAAIVAVMAYSLNSRETKSMKDSRGFWAKH